ncbi:hypothetical protein C0V70_18440 [Bacteriovorax stolpii]|uniref:Uncharacterized protein n=1 Tax=Bacteriovorax stolpii TaxID=960 RepID=A0A2K9NX15_BACTC|nr:response regulator [Bacteriovorax stolpii]AUO00047.1 hypothetical protein C0V70_18440 [Bacteriovorax stolpii]TDP54059.1 response regulator receiver domain-containing protein [Bacteriovorax stolpii]
MSKMLFFIDDDEDFLYVLSRVANKLDFISEIQTAKHGKAALDTLLSLREAGKRLPDTMFVDLNMPVMDGFEFLERFKKLRETYNEFKKIVPIIMLTSSHEDSDKKTALDMGIVENYVIKPAGIKNLENMLRDLVQ